FEDGGAKPALPASEENAIRFIVTDVLKKQDEEKKKKEEEAKVKLESEGYRVGMDLKMSARWDDGFKAETPNKDFTIHIGGRIQYDNVWWTQDPVTKLPSQIGDLQDGTFFRRIRLQMDGTFWEVGEFNFEYLFENVQQLSVGLDEMWVGITK